MKNADLSDNGDLKKRFHFLREKERFAAPAFQHLIQPAAITKQRPLFMIPLAAAAAICLIVVPAIVIRKSANPSLTARLPVLLPANPERRPLFAGLERVGPIQGFYSDQLLPFHLNLNL